ncbi:hypothetical protein HMPREF1321_2293 [Capnocytophaga sp. oral taxon 412 str. F0487]|uniref:hypothetical protein n=1 Tax=Capnocytophaga sp. oral taxon 412 TaxID=712218 RepID=UPI00026968B3|nr:hypothetical protein [Capnocytophaga sp. oral taxon 412]EIW90868.1 hypothetical protein HMPREF1321_2293 [Capnocytophaga sp. oral taxon 412 str. F0487]
MKKTLLLAIGLTLIFLSCKKDNNDETTPGGAFPKTIVEETIGSIGTVKTTETYTLSGNKITAFERKVVDNGTPTTDEVYTITYNGELITAISIKSNSQSNRNYTYNFTYNGNHLQSIIRSDNVQKITYEYLNNKVVSKTTVDGTETKKYSYTYEANKIKMIATDPTPGSNDRFTYTLNPDSTVASFEKIVYIGNIPREETKGTCTYQYDNKPNIYQRDLFKYLAEIELISNYNYYGDYYRDPLIRTATHNVISYTKNLHNNTQADYKDLENATRTFSYQWNSNNTPKSAEYKKNNAHKATYTYTY